MANESEPRSAPAMMVDQAVLASLRRRYGLPAAAEQAGVCAAPANMLFIDADGSFWGCDHTRDVAPALGTVGASCFGEAGLQRLQRQLAGGELPASPCAGCGSWLQQELLAPPLRECAGMPATPAAAPRRLVLRLPPDMVLADGTRAALAAWCEVLAELVLEVPAGAVAGLPALLASLPTGAAVRRLRLQGEVDWPQLAAQLRDAAIAGIEWTVLGQGYTAALKAQSAARELSAELSARFVLTSEQWHYFEEVVRACAAAGLPLELCVRDRGGLLPLAALSIENLNLVKDVVVGSWSRLGGQARPASLAEGAFDRMLAELRSVLSARIEAAIAGGEGAAGPLLRLPRPDHPWFQDEERRRWWLGCLFGNGHLSAVRDWLLRITADPVGEAAVRRDVWLRTLVHRLAADQRIPELLELLRRIYADPRQRSKLAAADAAFAAAFDLQPYGGPWAERLGLGKLPARRRPFALGKARAPQSESAPDLTVLVPSYRHAEYIEETLRSVLASRFTNFRLLVVDDCSPDGTVAAAERVVDPRLEVRCNERNLGLGNSVLQALATIDTPFVALLNSDDLFHPERLGRCREALLQHPEVQLVTTAITLIDGKGGELTPANASLVLDGKLVFDWVHWFTRISPPAELPQKEVFAALLERNFLVTSSNLVARTDWLRAQAASLQSLKFCLDWQLFLEAALADALLHLPEPLIAYRLHATNTVWFREGRRWSYYLEVNRVAAEALRRFAARGRDGGEAEVVRVLEAIAGHLTINRETDGFALFLNTAFDALQVDQLAADSPPVQALVQRLNALAEQVRRDRDQVEQLQSTRQTQHTELRLLLGRLERERADGERDRRRWLQGYAEQLEQRLADCWSGREQLQRSHEQLREAERELATRVEQLVGECAGLRVAGEGAEVRLQEARRELDRLQGQLAALTDFRRLIDEDLVVARRERDQQAALLADERAEREQMRSQLQELAASLLRGQVELLEQHRLARELREARDSLAAEMTAELNTVRGEVAQLQQVRDELRQERADLQRSHQELHREHQDLQQQRDDLHREHEQLQREWNDQRLRQEALEAQREALKSEHHLLRGEHAELSSRFEGLQRTQLQLAAERQQLQQRLDTLAAELQRRGEQVASLQAERADLQQRLAGETTQVAALAAAKESLLRSLDEASQSANRLRGENETMRASREFRAGNFLWNKMPLGYMTRRSKKWYRRVLDAKDRCRMWVSKLLTRRGRTEGKAVVAACWQWPIYSHTFVYQEMIGLTHMGLDVKLFHWDLGNLGELHQAFRYLADNRTQLQPVWENHLRDRDHFEKTRPGRLRAFLERVAAATGKPVEQLEKEPLVLQGCTFARMAELAGADYLHSYFFYDQSFMVMQAAWLLGLPRGVSCYADHMLKDYDYKLVPLQVELSDVIVATSARIKRELLAMTGGKFGDKIIVKPNGVDGGRFPAVQRTVRQPGDPFEVISISRIEPKKGLIHLVEALAELKQQGHRVKAHIVGSKDPHSRGSLEFAAEFERRIAELGVQEEVVLHGMKKQEELAPILQRCRAFVAPYVELGSGDKDGIPTAMLEGLASGLPVVTTDSGSILEVVRNGVEGLVVPQRNSAAFAAALRRLIEDPALERKLAAAARARFDREFDIRVTERRLHERVAGLIARNQRQVAR